MPLFMRPLHINFRFKMSLKQCMLNCLNMWQVRAWKNLTVGRGLEKLGGVPVPERNITHEKY